ncbi:reverse transcriptase domain-containing protein [Tanacetum coccineum]
MDDDLFTYEVEVANILCNSNKDDDSEQRMSHEVDDDMGYDPSDVAFTKWLGLKKFNYKTIDHYTRKVLWIYWIRGDDEVELTDEEFPNNEDEVAEVFRIDTNIFDFETPMCKTFKEFNYLLQIDLDLLTKDIEGFNTYDEYKDDWIYEWNKDIPWVDEKPWTKAGVWTEPKPVKTYLTSYCNGGDLPGAYHIGNSLHYQDLEWYKALEDSELKNEALRNKAIMKGLINDDESSNDCWKRWKIHEIYYHNYDEGDYENETHKERHELCGIETRECMRTRSSSNLITESSTTPKHHNRRRSKQRVKPFSLEETHVDTMADQRTMAKLLQAPTEGYGDAIVIPAILAENFELKHGLSNLVTLKQFYGFEKEEPHAHIHLVSKFINQLFPPSKTTNLRNEITNFQQHFDESFYEAWDRFKDLLRACPHHGFTELHQLDTFYNTLTPTDQDSLNAAAGGNLLTKTPQDALTIIENKSKVRNSQNKPIVTKVSTNAPSSSTPHSPEIVALVDAVKAMLAQKSSPPASVKAVEEICITCGGPHPYHQCLATDGNIFLEYRDNIQGYVSTAAVNYNQGNIGYRPQNVANQIQPPGFAQPNVQNNQTQYNQGDNQNKGNNKGNPSYQAPIQQAQVAPSNEFLNYKKINDANMKAMQNQINNVKNESRNEMQTSIQTSMSNQTNKLKNMMASYFQMNNASSSGSGSLSRNTVANPRGDLKAITTRSGISYDGPLIPPLPKMVERVPEGITFELSFTDALLHISKFASMFKSLLNNKEKLFDLAKTPVNENCSAVILKKLPEKLGDPDKFLIPCDFLELVECLALADLDRSTTSSSVDDEAITFKVGQTSRYSYNDDVSINRIDVIDVACEKYAQKVLGFSNSSTSSNLTPSLDPILSTSSPSLTPFDEGDFIFEEIKACLTNDSIPLGIDDDDFDPEGDLFLIKKLLNDDPSSPLPPKELHVEELKIVKSSIDDPPELELNNLPSHLEYAFLEGTNKLPVIIAKNLKEDEKVRLLKVLKSHKRAIAWKISDIKGIDPQFCTHKILMEDDSKPAIQHQRRVNLKIREVIKKEVIKLLEAGLIYPIFDSPWVSPVHCVPKKGGITVIENEDNELIPTRLVTGWRVCIDYRKLNDATRKDHFPLPFMDQMLERLAGNEYYCFLDGFSGYFQIPIDPQDQEKTTFTCPYGTFAYRRMPFGLCNAPGTFQRCMMAIFHDMIEETMEVFMDDFSVFGDSFS